MVFVLLLEVETSSVVVAVIVSSVPLYNLPVLTIRIPKSGGLEKAPSLFEAFNHIVDGVSQ